jgi:AcrR family transcriptional regulator
MPTAARVAAAQPLTKAALYYHFRTKEDIITGLFEDLAGRMDEILSWAREQEDQRKAREELLRRLAVLIEGKFGPLLRFLQENQPAMKQFQERNPLVSRMTELFKIIVADEEDPRARLRARLSLVALLIGNNPQFQEENPGADPAEIALQVALELVSPGGHETGRAT